MQRRKQATLLVLTGSGAGDVTAAINAMAGGTAVHRVRGP